MRIHSPQITGSAENTNIVTVTRITSLSALSASFASTASSADNLTVRGTLTAQTINVQTITSSIDYVTGSSINGSLLANTHQFTGSVSVTGSLQVNESNVILTNQTSSMSVATASYWSGSIINATSASYALTASYASNVPETASYALQALSASFALTASYISGSGAGVGFPFSGSAIITGSLFVSGSTISGSFKGDGSQITGLTAGGKIHTQSSAASTWTVTHNLGVQYPNVTVYNSSNEIIIPQTITATDTNILTLTFGSAVAGYAVAGIGGIINVQGRTTQQYFTASTTWSFAHNLGDKYVSLQAFDDAFEMMIPTTIRLVDFTSSLILFDSASSGYAVATIGGDLPAISSSYAGYTLQVANSAPYSASWVAAANVTVTNAVSSSFAATASSADNLTVRGTLTAQTINVQTITSSIDFVTGSTRNGTLLTNTHEFTGSVSITGSAAALLNINNGVLFVSASGNVGIGTTSPIEKLDITKNGNQTDVNWGSIMIRNIANYAVGNDASIGFALNNSGNTNCDPRASIGCKTESTLGGALVFNTRLDAGTYTEKMRITGAGNVGIGNTTPGLNLSVQGLYGLPATSGTQNVGIFRAQDSSSNISLDMGVIQYFGSWIQSINKANSSVLTLALNPNGGSIGIGTTTIASDYKLAVYGTNSLMTFQNVNTGQTNGDGFAVGSFGNVDAYLYNYENANIIFGTNATERMRITSGGVVYVNTTTNPTPANAAPQFGVLAGTGTDAVNVKHTVNGNNTLNIWQTGTTQHASIAFYKGDSQDLRGNIIVSTSAVSYNTTSDYRLKENISPIVNSLDRVMQLKPSKFNWIETGEESEGFIAHELQEIFPYAVAGEKDAIYSSTGNIKPQSVDYGRITPLLVKAIQELSAKNTTLEEILQRNNIQ
jgi:hypothetical protein